ncbi:MAG: hypothetical protein LW697_10550 [Blastopirellula sp.]|nr:hypothetical protein [Blastopirellula sp.]
MSLAEMSQRPIPDALAQREATARLLWTGGIIAFFAIQAVLWIVAITLTSQDPSHVVFEGYDQRALNWADQNRGWDPGGCKRRARTEAEVG